MSQFRHENVLLLTRYQRYIDWVVAGSRVVEWFSPRCGNSITFGMASAMTRSYVYEIPMCGCPLRLGTPLKVATTAWDRWGIRWQAEHEFDTLVSASEEAYDEEWSLTDGSGLRDIARAAELSGLGDANHILNEAVAREVELLCEQRANRLCIVDVGAGTGETTRTIVQMIPRLANQASFHLVEPARNSLAEARVRLGGTGLTIGETLHTHAIKDLGILGPLLPSSADLVVANAALHHHAFLSPVFERIATVLRPGGWVVIGDWFNTMCLNPAWIFRLLSSLEWDDKEQQLAQFRRRFGLSESVPDEAKPEVNAANRQICDFWLNYARTKNPSSRSYLVLEGHRTPEEYISGLARWQLYARRGPLNLLKGSMLLSILVAQKGG